MEHSLQKCYFKKTGHYLNGIYIAQLIYINYHLTLLLFSSEANHFPGKSEFCEGYHGRHIGDLIAYVENRFFNFMLTFLKFFLVL